MSTDKIGFSNERIERFFRDRTGEERWRVEDAKTKLSQLMKNANHGEAQVVGLRNPVILIGMKELEEMMLRFNEPETWGEYFYPAVTEEGIGGELELPERKRRARDSYDIMGEYGEAEKGKEAKRDLRDEMSLVKAYAKAGDEEAADSVIEEMEESMEGGESDEKSDFVEFESEFEMAALASESNPTENTGSFSLQHFKTGDVLRASIAGVGRRRLLLNVDGQVAGFAFVKKENTKRYVKGHEITARCVAEPSQTRLSAFSVVLPEEKMLRDLGIGLNVTEQDFQGMGFAQDDDKENKG